MKERARYDVAVSAATRMVGCLSCTRPVAVTYTISVVPVEHHHCASTGFFVWLKSPALNPQKYTPELSREPSRRAPFQGIDLSNTMAAIEVRIAPEKDQSLLHFKHARGPTHRMTDDINDGASGNHSDGRFESKRKPCAAH